MNAFNYILAILGIMGGVISLVTAVVKRRKIAVQISSIFLILVGVIVIIGYLADDSAIYTFPGNKIGMALPTGVCFEIVGICLWILATEIEFKKTKE